ncbi:MAG: hypothetical protein COB66_05790 [Coxiella sp. (in: Bacteria)]|nr:MAG: hypothetical protein COB66_05790 [Coxiella sp. (in: g-proteobacteria)]
MGILFFNIKDLDGLVATHRGQSKKKSKEMDHLVTLHAELVRSTDVSANVITQVMRRLYPKRQEAPLVSLLVKFKMDMSAEKRKFNTCKFNSHARQCLQPLVLKISAHLKALSHLAQEDLEMPDDYYCDLSGTLMMLPVEWPGSSAYCDYSFVKDLIARRDDMSRQPWAGINAVNPGYEFECPYTRAIVTIDKVKPVKRTQVLINDFCNRHKARLPADIQEQMETPNAWEYIALNTKQAAYQARPTRGYGTLFSSDTVTDQLLDDGEERPRCCGGCSLM